MEEDRRPDDYWLRIEDYLEEIKAVVKPSEKVNDFGHRVTEALEKHPIKKPVESDWPDK